MTAVDPIADIDAACSQRPLYSPSRLVPAPLPEYIEVQNRRRDHLSKVATAYTFVAWILIALNLGNAVRAFMEAGFQNHADTHALLSAAVSVIAAFALGELSRARRKLP